MIKNPQICLVGFGEVGQRLCSDLNGQDLIAWDIKFSDGASQLPIIASRQGVKRGASAQHAVQQADLIISAVTAAQSYVAAANCVAGLQKGTYFLDLNSSSPSTKRATGKLIEDAGGRYIEAAIMSPIEPHGIATAMLLGGKHAAQVLDSLKALGFSGARIFSEEVGGASATKMCRSVLIKGIEALLTESMLTARHYGVEKAVLASLVDFFPGTNWRQLSHYMIGRAVQHGARRAEEMREVARTVTDAGITPLMSAACASRQDWASQFGDALREDELDGMLDSIIADMKS